MKRIGHYGLKVGDDVEYSVSRHMKALRGTVIALDAMDMNRGTILLDSGQTVTQKQPTASARMT